MKEKMKFKISFFPVGDSQKSKRVFLEGLRLVGGFGESRDLVFFTKSVKFGFGELSISQICAESRDLGPEHGFRGCSFENIRKKLDVHTSWDQKTENKRKSGTKSVELRSPEL